MLFSLRASLALFLSILVVAAGCGSADYDIVPVSGTVTLDGEPLDGAHVSFQPMGGTSPEQVVGSGSFGRTDAEGHYSLQIAYPREDGVAVGTHRVRITTSQNESDADNARLIGEKVPRFYLDEKVKLVKTVTEPSDAFNIELFSDFKAAREAAAQR